MAFKSKEELEGQIDPNINTRGRIKGEKELTRRQIKDRELIGILRKIKPHLSDSITVAAAILKNKEAAHANQLKAAVILLNAYKELIGDVYDAEDDVDADGKLKGAPVVQETPQPVFSLKMLS